jgi:hypothetical protein
MKPKLHTEDPQIFCTTPQNLVAHERLAPGICTPLPHHVLPQLNVHVASAFIQFAVFWDVLPCRLLSGTRIHRLGSLSPCISILGDTVAFFEYDSFLFVVFEFLLNQRYDSLWSLANG